MTSLAICGGAVGFLCLFVYIMVDMDICLILASDFQINGLACMFLFVYFLTIREN